VSPWWETRWIGSGASGGVVEIDMDPSCSRMDLLDFLFFSFLNHALFTSGIILCLSSELSSFDSSILYGFILLFKTSNRC
jgi:hypothetical protein